MRYQAVYTQNGWGVRDNQTGALTDEMVGTAGAAHALAESHERHDERIEERIDGWQNASAAEIMEREG